MSDSKSPQISWTLVSILAVLNNVVVSTRHVISKSSSPCTNPLVTVPSATITVDITLTFMFLSFFVLRQGPSTCLSFYFLWLTLCGPPGRQSPLNGRFFFFFFFSIFLFCLNHHCFVFWLNLGDLLVSQNPREF